MSTVNAVRARLLALWESFLHLRTQEEDRWRASVGEPPAEEPAAKPEAGACSRPERPQPLAELVAERQQETISTVQPTAPARDDTTPDLTALIAQRQQEHHASHGDEPNPKD